MRLGYNEEYRNNNDQEMQRYPSLFSYYIMNPFDMDFITTY